MATDSNWPSSWFIENTAKDLIDKSGVRIDADTMQLQNLEALRYGVGGHFAEHVDRSRGKSHIGTLLFVIPSTDLEGGDLLFLNEGSTSPPSGRRPYVAFIPLGIKHAVKPVTAGVRRVLKAAVFAKHLRAGKPLKPRRYICD
jgi:hypothetical protein